MAVVRVQLVTRESDPMSVVNPTLDRLQRFLLGRQIIALIFLKRRVVIPLRMEALALVGGDAELRHVLIPDSHTCACVAEGALGKSVFAAYGVPPYVAEDVHGRAHQVQIGLQAPPLISQSFAAA